MAYSDSKKSNLDWREIRETVKLLNLSTAQVDAIMQESESAVNTLTDLFTDLVESMQATNMLLLALADSADREQALACCTKTQHKIQSAIITFQYYDRMQQCLQHVTSNMRGLSNLIESPERLNNPNAWQELQTQIRSKFTMESEKVMFDAIVQGKSVEEAIEAKAAFQRSESENVELF